MKTTPRQSRRQFLTGAAGLTFIPRHVLGAPGVPAASDRITVGFIGAGNRANLLMDQLPAPGQIAAVADCYLTRAEEAAAKRKKTWDVYGDYRRILDRKDIDAVVVATTDHGRVIPSIHACQAGKDIYAEKPLTLYIAEGRALVEAARKYKRVVQVGTQQRSMEMCQIACKLVRDGGLGKLHLVQTVCYPSSSPIPANLPTDPKPDKLNWDMWLGQAPMHEYSKKLQFSWMSWREFAGGEMTNWGAHGLDMIQMALGADHTGPVELWPLEWPKGAIGMRYANDVTVHMELPPSGNLMGGGRFIGEKGSIDIWRNNFKIDAGDMKLDLPPQEEIDKWHDKRALWQAQYHMGFWLECIPTRKTPNADVEIGHRSVTVSHLANITRQLNRKLRWNPETERFVDDKDADLLANRPRRRGWELPAI
ncbi:MAG: Gfo/Idh/MocA family oxidoreductase [Acidobacteria bacterium]|nr:Gfo/Idh/MocA family oxidoreductase [Acidobacteriota bacterium]